MGFYIPYSYRIKAFNNTNNDNWVFTQLIMVNNHMNKNKTSKRVEIIRNKPILNKVIIVSETKLRTNI